MPVELDKNSILSFGKYKGKTGYEVACTNPSYILWIERNLDFYTISPALHKVAVSVGIIQSEERADAYGTAGDWGFDPF